MLPEQLIELLQAQGAKRFVYTNADRDGMLEGVDAEEVKRISSWAAILFAPSIIGSVYGMNFRFMPELSWVWGYPMALGLMLVTGVVLYVVFRFKRWL